MSWLGGGRVIETCGAVPFSHTVFSSYKLSIWVGGALGYDLDSGHDGLDTPVEGTAVDALDGRRKGAKVCGEFMGLLDAFAGEGRIGGDSCGGWDGRVIFPGFSVYRPVGAELS